MKRLFLIILSVVLFASCKETSVKAKLLYNNQQIVVHSYLNLNNYHKNDTVVVFGSKTKSWSIISEYKIDSDKQEVDNEFAEPYYKAVIE